MPLAISLLVILAAVLHASWNALLRAGGDRLWSITIMCSAIAIVCAALAPFVPLPARVSWTYAAASGMLHVGYNLFLVRTYRHGDMGQTYPIARGSSPLLVTLGAAAFAHELPGGFALVGVVLTSAGIILLAFQRRGPEPSSLPYALGTGCFISAYSVTDGIGVRLSGTAIGYTVWMCLCEGVLALLAYLILRNWRSLARGRRETWTAAGGGIASLIAYGIIIFAMTRSPMGPVSALRETSVVFAALIGRVFLHERLTAYRIGACIVVAAGAICIGHAGLAQ